MPIYEYRARHPEDSERSCGTCRQPYERIQRIDDEPLTECGECGGLVEKLVSRTAFRLGSGGVGWYREGYSGSGK